MDQFLLRRLNASDAEAFRDIRLEGLRNHPEAFGSSWEEESERPLAWFEERLTRGVERRALKVGDRYYDELLMTRSIKCD